MSELKGRYLKALVDSPFGGQVKAGEYGLIQSNDLYKIDFPNHKSYAASNALIRPDLFELMPIGFDPNKTSYPYIAVITDTQQEWDFAISKCTPGSTLYKSSKSFDTFKKQYPEGIAICIKDNAYCGIDWYKKQGALIYTFQEWYKLHGYSPEKTEWIPKVGEYAIMENAGGWGFSPQNNGSLALITNVGASIDGKDYPISGKLIRKSDNHLTQIKFTDVPVRSDRYPGIIICRKALPHEIPTDAPKEISNKLTIFPTEGCVYDSIENLMPLCNYLVNRPMSGSDGTTKKEEAIGIAWSSTSQWWLKTTRSEKPNYKITDLNHFFKQDTMTYKFNIGDTVKVIAQTSGWGEVKPGDIGIIKQTPNPMNNYTVDFPKHKFWHGKEECFELVKSANDNFTLPPSWYITVTEENNAALTKWRGYKLTVGQITGMYDWGGRIAKEHDHRHDGSGWGLQITFDQFKKYVLKEPANIQSTDTIDYNFVLPQKWYVRATKENEQVLKDWRKGNHIGWSDDLVMSSVKKWNNVANAKREDYAEITYQQFQQHVLNLSTVDILATKYPYGITLEKNTDYNVIKKPTDITIPLINPVFVKVDFTISNKLMDIRLPNFNVTPEQIKTIKVEKFTVSL